jgi:predicted DNA-binding transcriptional regulator AlpA
MKQGKERANSYEELPLVLNVSDIQQIMGISRASTYQLVRSKGFPAVRHGRIIKVSKRAFFDWLDNGYKNTPKETHEHQR